MVVLFQQEVADFAAQALHHQIINFPIEDHCPVGDDFKHIGGILPKVAFTSSGAEYLTNIAIEKDPKGWLIKDKEEVYDWAAKKPSSFDTLLDNGKVKDMVRELNEQSEKRERLVAQLTPEQRKVYDEETRAYKNWSEQASNFPIAYGKRPPNTPMHDAIERMSNKNGLTDREELEQLTVKGNSLDTSWMMR